MKEWGQIAGGALLTLVLVVYAARLLPFVLADPDELPRRDGQVLSKATESLSGSTNATALTYLVTIEPAGGTGRIESKIGAAEFASVSVGESIDVVMFRGRALAAADVRWQGPHRSRFWLILAAAVLFGGETVRRLFRCLWRRDTAPAHGPPTT